MIETTTNKNSNLWNRACAVYNECISKCKQIEIESVLIEIIYRCGFESGFISKLLHRNNINWGTYTDRLGTHCNAHCNNLIILPFAEFLERDVLLSPLDFDMSFDESEFIAKMDACSFKELMVMELNAMRASLCGDPEISTGVHFEKDKNNQNEEKNRGFDLIRCALTDTLISAFDEAYNGKHQNTQNQFKWNENKRKLMYSIFNLALIETIDITA